MKTILEIYKAEVQSPARVNYGIKAANKAFSETTTSRASLRKSSITLIHGISHQFQIAKQRFNKIFASD